MICLDSNVVLRYLAQDDSHQSTIATHLIEQQISEREPGYLSLVVLAEVAWVMASSFGADRTLVAKVVDGLLSAPQLRIENAAEVWMALDEFGQGSADFSDALIGVLAREAGCRSTLTFDIRASRHPGFELLR